MKAIQILSVAPYEELQNMVAMVAAEYAQIHLDFFTGNLERAIEYVAAFPQQKFDAIISRGGTAKFLRQHVDIPVIEIEISTLDMLRALKLAERCGEPFAVVGYGSIIRMASGLCDVLQYDRPIIREITMNNVRQQIEELRDQGVQMILGDVIASETAEEVGLLSILIASSKESVAAAFESAIALCRNIARDQAYYKLYRDIVDCIQVGIVIFDRSGRYIQSNHLAKTMDQEMLMETLQKYLPLLQEQGELRTYKKSCNQLLEITGQIFLDNGNQYSCFFIRMSYKTSSIIPGIAVEHLEEKTQGKRLFLFAPKIQSTINMIEDAIQSNASVIIVGEQGMQKTALARYIHSQSRRRSGMFIHISCDTLQDRQWTQFTSNISSPINGKDCTVFFENIHRLAPNIQTQLSAYIDDTLLYKRNRIICSSVVDLQELVMKEQFSLALYELLSQSVIFLPPLRERREDIPTLVNLLLNQLNVENNKSVGGVEPEAMAILQSYTWPLNLVQFEKTMSRLVKNSNSYLITAEEAAREMQQCWSTHVEAALGMTIDLQRPLDEIEKDIIHQVLAEVGMNQSVAAKRLGISRSTLWRKLK
ncbi:MAG: PrpR N-terminal domain-containing protein [Clostridia bacterium]|nr:PrpR N-terminal domain-containing protein [Clostridia bacterium]